ncbi:unnamed protein product [Lactuca saligna]|uniref:Uncharacterized protein n=1 Tax=Lactuca saligna TaxID=75948 RepID=A0AA35ZJS4_LACSI|nr:unnamed protein product [Lactuca saligna]
MPCKRKEANPSVDVGFGDTEVEKTLSLEVINECTDDSINISPLKHVSKDIRLHECPINSKPILTNTINIATRLTTSFVPPEGSIEVSHIQSDAIVNSTIAPSSTRVTTFPTDVAKKDFR